MSFATEVQQRREGKAEEHNSAEVSFRSYCPFGLSSAAEFLHREALRVLVCAKRGDNAGAFEHLIDVGVFCDLIYTEFFLNKESNASFAGCPFLADPFGALPAMCRITSYHVDVRQCTRTWTSCPTYQKRRSEE